MEVNKIYNEDCLEGMKKLPNECVDCIVTSPPYFGLRDYGVEGQIGMEETPEQFVQKLVEIFREAKRVLKDTGTLWLNLGDSYAGSGRGLDADGSWNPGDGTSKQGTNRNNKNQIRKVNPDSLNKSAIDNGALGNKWVKPPLGYKPKDLIGILWMVAFALRTDGYYLRQDIIWNKPNPMPESVTDRCTKSHEYIFLLSKSKKYYYDQEAIMTPLKNKSIARLAQDIELQKGSTRVPGKKNGAMKAVTGHKIGSKKYDLNDPISSTKSGKEWQPTMAGAGSKIGGHNGYFDRNGELICDAFANKKSVWTVTTKPFKEAHFATFPEELIVDCIKAGCPEGGIVLDCFMGAGTTALVARKLNRNFIGFELNPDYIKIAEKRLYNELGIFL